MSVRASKFLRGLAVCLAAAIVLVALLLGAFGYVVGRVPEYRVQLQTWLSERSGLDVQFRSLRARLRTYGPELIFDDAVVSTPDGTRVLATASRGSVAFDWWSSLRTRRLTAGRFSLQGPQIDLIRTREGRIQLLGQNALPERSEAKPFAIEHLPTGRFHVTRAIVSFRDEATGRGPWSVSGVNFDLRRNPSSMHLQGDASLPPALGRELRFSANIQGELGGSATLESAFAVEGQGLELAGWAGVLPDTWPAGESGRGSLRVSGAMHGLALTQLSADVAFTQVATVLPHWATPLPMADPMRQPRAQEQAADEEPRQAAPLAVAAVAAPAPPQVLRYDRLAFALRAERMADAWHLSLTDLDLATANSPWHAARIEATWSQGTGGAFEIDGQADRLVLQNVWPLLAYLPESSRLARLRALDASGTVEDLTLRYQRTSAAAEPSYSMQAQLSQLAFKPIGQAPGLAQLSGQLRATEQGGHGMLAAPGLRFELPRLFRDPIVLQAADGIVDWQRSDAGWVVTSPDIHARNPDGQVAGKFVFTVPHDGSSPVLDLTAQGQNLQVSATPRYLPAGRLGAKSVEWFDRAFVAGQVESAQVNFQGPIRAFPFRHGEGTFLARAQVEHAVFDYQPGWTPARDITAEVEFRNQGLSARAQSANVAGLQVRDAQARIADLKDARVVLQASAQGPLPEGLLFLRRSPLGPKLGERFARLDGTGAIEGSVHLDLPIKSIEERVIDVTARFSDASVSMRGVAAPVSALTGFLRVRNTRVAEAALRGQWLGGELQLDIPPQSGGSTLSASGWADADELHGLLGLPQTVRLSGATRWDATATLDQDGGADSGSRSVSLHSDLRGMGIRLPQPLGKSEADASALQLTLQFTGNDVLLARGAMGTVRSLIRLRRAAADTGGAWELDRGGVRADGIAPSLPDHRGLRIEGSIERFVLDDWLALKATGQGRPLSDTLQAANVRVGEFQLWGYRWTDVRGLLQATPSGWRIDASGPDAAGQIVIPESFTGAQPLTADLERLVLRKSGTAGGSSDQPVDPRQLPNMQLHIADLQWADRVIGTVDLDATRVPQGIRFNTTNSMGEAARGEGRGEWLVTPAGQQSSMTATVTSSNVAQTLHSLGYSEFLDARRGEIHADLSWPGGFTGNILAHASGAISVLAEAGQLINLQPGAGRVLGLFSVAALPRRLALDFSDLTDKGLAFDMVHGDFELRDGNAYTNNLLLRGPAAEIGIAGRTGLRTRDYDQTAVVTGNLGASLPVAGVLAGGPAIGAALLLFSQVFKEPLKGMTRGYYRISGPWDEPLIERVDAADVKADPADERSAKQKAGQGAGSEAQANPGAETPPATHHPGHD